MLTTSSLRSHTGRPLGRVGWVRTSVLVVAFLLGAGCSSGADESDPATTTASSSTPTTTQPTTTTDLVPGVTNPELGDPLTIELPAAESADETVVYLLGPGSAAVVLVSATRPLRDHREDACGEVADALGAAGTPAEIQATIVDIPDPTTREIMLGLFTLTGDRLGACSGAGAGDQDVTIGEFDWQWELANRRLADLGVPS